LISDDAKKAIKKMDSKTAGRVFKGIMGLPLKGDIKPLSGKYIGKHRLRIGDWGLAYNITFAINSRK
jgi:mRNA-degrading endonuclease RelE of RelBE toxin-antitoxin system